MAGAVVHSCTPHPIWRIPLAEDKLYKAEYHGSGTFTISKPKRKEHKKRQTKVKNPQRGARRYALGERPCPR